MAGAGHLVKRFAGSLVPGGPRAADAAWAEEQLLPAEVEIWRRMSAADRRHAAGVARRVAAALGPDVERAVLAAALLHDCGKTVSGLGTYGRVIATLSAGVAGRDQAVAWSETRGFTRRVGLYVEHPRLGADLLDLAGSDPVTIAWAREHHLPDDEWTVPAAVGAALKAADDD
ncbi:MAG: hypothetical protein JWN46_1709 [Acidimicrobiales bacterium]|nr:hypothetical protein [Acidimicrobiales bacterium]